VGGARRSSDDIAAGSAEIAIGNSDLRTRTEQQASNLQQTAASVEELSATVKNNAGLVGQAVSQFDQVTPAGRRAGRGKRCLAASQNHQGCTRRGVVGGVLTR